MCFFENAVHFFQRATGSKTGDEFRGVIEFVPYGRIGAVGNYGAHVFQRQFAHHTHGSSSEGYAVQNNIAVGMTLCDFVDPQRGIEPFENAESDIVAVAVFSAAVIRA